MGGSGGGGALGSVTDVIGITDYAGQEKLQKEAARAGREATAVSKEGLAFQKEQYEDWQAVYGDIQKNLGDYYKNIDPDRLASLGLQNQQRELQLVQADLKRSFAQRGLSGSGLETGVLSDVAIQGALNRAKIRTDAPEQARQLQTNFLSLGLGQGAQMRQGISGAYGQLGQTYLSRQSIAAQQAIATQQSNTATINAIIGGGAGIATGLS